jgi:ATP-binding cassette, subfamily B, bacterial PglK
MKKNDFISKFLHITREHHKSLVLMSFLFLLNSGLEVFGTGMIGPFVAIATNPESIKKNDLLSLAYSQLGFESNENFLIALGLSVVFIFYVKALLSFNAQKKIFEFSFGLRRSLILKLMQAYMDAPYSFHLRKNSATLIQNVITTTDQICVGLVITLLSAIANAVVTFALLILLIYTDAMALLLIGMILLVAFGVMQSMKGRLVRWGKEGWEASSEMIRIVNHGLGSLKETRIIGCEPYFQGQMDQQTYRYASNSSLAAAYGNLPRYIVEAIMVTFLVIFTLLFIKINEGSAQDLTAVLGVFALASIRLLPAIGNTIAGVGVMRSNTHALDKLYYEFKELEDLNNLDRQQISKKIDDPVIPVGATETLKEIASKFNHNIQIVDLAFQYLNARGNALDGISLTIEKGESIGLIGKSGSGKTTLVDVILGLYNPQVGDIKVDGESVYGNLRAWQNMLGYVPQSIFLIDDTLERNIAFGVPDTLIDQGRLEKAIAMAQLGEVIGNLPDGVKTIVGERGVLLSGGQRQRVGIARVLYHEREILVFDEATSALDAETESLVTEATKALSGEKTIIIIAHRLSTIEHCDRIYQLDRGRVVKSGSYRNVVLGE